MGCAPSAWVVDVDGTLALRGNRSPYDWRSAGEDLPNRPVVTVVQALAAHRHANVILLISGREERARIVTEDWLREHKIPFHQLLMRQNGDNRADEIIKEEIYLQQIEPGFSVQGVIDDRRRVVAMWRRLGLTCLQVDDGDF